MRTDAYNAVQKKEPDRKKVYGGKINLKKIDKRKLKKVHETDDKILYEGIVNSVNLKRNIKLCYVQMKTDGKPANKYAALFSTDLNHSAITIFTYYKGRFQIEFIFRDAKQHTGLTHNQARSISKMNFLANASLTAINIAKAIYYSPLEKSEKKSFFHG